MRLCAIGFALAAAAIVATWAWLGAAVDMPASPFAAGEKMQCISYAPFRGDQSPFGPDVPINPHQIEEDLTALKPLTDCIRTYSVDHGLDQIPEIARRHGMKVMLGLWLSSLPDLSRQQIETAIALAKRYPDVVQSIVVGNEVLLRGEMSAPDLISTIRGVKARVTVPVTYADVWEFWLRYREVASVVDFITIHILPYWEDFPVPVEKAAAHVATIRLRMADAFPGREILLGEFGWPSAGRMREGALPSPANQARVLALVLAQARRDNYRVNIIEAFDQPWKRQLEGTVGGHWGLFGAYDRAVKFAWGGAVSNHPAWRWQAAGGVGLAAAVFALALAAGARGGAPLERDDLSSNRHPALHYWWSMIFFREPVSTFRDHALTARGWLAVATMAFVSGALIGWTVENVPRESLTYGDWLRSLAWAAVAVAVPMAGAAALATRTPVPAFAAVLGRRIEKVGPLARLLAMLQLAVAVLAVEAALGLDFDPRYRDFPFAPLTGSVFPFLTIALLHRFGPRAERKGARPAAEAVMAMVLGLSALYIVLNETAANWQALWFCAGLSALALTLWLARDAPS